MTNRSSLRRIFFKAQLLPKEKIMTLYTALKQERPLQIVGTINAYSALLTKQAGFHALYLLGASVANASYGLPDLGITSLDNVLKDVRRITNAVDFPLLVDVGTGWGSVKLRSLRKKIR